MVVTRLDDQNDELLADYRSVSDPALAGRRGVFIAEGRLVVRRLLTDSALKTRSVMVTPTAFAAIQDVLERIADLPVYVVPQDVMNGIVGFNIHRGCLAIGERPPARRWRDLARQARGLLALERIGDADNVGSIFRAAAALGAEAVLLGPACADPLYRKAIRTSMGAALIVPFAHVDTWEEGPRALASMGHAVIAMTPHAEAIPLHAVARAVGGRPFAIVLGHEGEGLTAETLGACEYRARIPMAAGADSLNVATSAAIALYELNR
jgi:tRNA G18 (ribose-2'-O)-methylase SpoU